MNKEKRRFAFSVLTVALWASIPAIIILVTTGNFLAYFSFGIWVIMLISMLGWGAYYYPPNTPWIFQRTKTKKAKEERT